MVNKSRSGFSNIYMVELLYRNKPSLDRAGLNRAMHQVAPASGKKSLGWEKAGDENTFIYFHNDYLVTYRDKSSPSQTCVMPHQAPITPERFRDGLRQIWHWPQAQAVLQECTYSLLVTDFLASSLYYKDRLDIFQNALGALMKAAPCDAIYWYASQKFLEPAKYLEAIEFNETLYGAVNIRLFDIENNQPRSGHREVLMDTCGLAALGIPDLQCHFYTAEALGGSTFSRNTAKLAQPAISQTLTPNTVRDFLLDVAYVLFDKGNIFENGDFCGVDEDKQWRCEHQHAMAKPDRFVLDLDPGSPHYAGFQSHKTP